MRHLPHPRSMTALTLLLGGASLLAAAPAPAAPNTAERVAAFKRLPDWTGLWEMGRPGGPGGPPAQAPGAPGAKASALPDGPSAGENFPYNATWEARYQATQQQLAAYTGTAQVPDNTVTRCIWGVPRIFAGPYEFEVTVTPEDTFFNYDVREFRHIWTDGRRHPAHVRPSDMGDSIGHWEGQTLVVDTVGVTPGLWIDAKGATLSAAARISERWTQPDHDHLQVDVTVHDPVAFTRALHFTRTFRRITDTNRIVQQNCFEDIHEQLQGGEVRTVFAPDQGSPASNPPPAGAPAGGQTAQPGTSAAPAGQKAQP